MPTVPQSHTAKLKASGLLRPCPITQARQAQRQRDRKEQYRQQDARRGNARERGYGAEWDRMAKQYLKAHPVCEICWKRPSTCVDHRISKADGGSDTSENMQAACPSCNARKGHAEAKARRQRQQRKADPLGRF